MHRSLLAICSVLAAITFGSGSINGQTTSGGAISPDKGGAPGYQHAIERSRFATGGNLDQSYRPVEEFGFLKIVGPKGVFATNLRNGLVIALQSDSTNKGRPQPEQDGTKAGKILGPDEHNKMVVDYFVSSGVPRDQVGGIHANTYLSASGSKDNPQLSPPKVDGYASIIERRLNGKFFVAESVAWARLDNDGQVITEWVYWPAIPAKAIADAKRIDEMTVGAQKGDYLNRLPVGLRDGTIVIHHSPATDEGPFEVIATFDAIETKQATMASADGKGGGVELTDSTVRHFDVNGNERRLSYERLNQGPSDDKPE
jgi:hypothetical protein